MTDASRDSYLRRKYNISLQQYDAMLRRQKNECALCKRHRSEFKQNFAVDHDHKTGKIRGLLCSRCNYLVGMVERYASDTIEPFAQNLYGYLFRKKK